METKKTFEESTEQRALHSYQRGLAIMLHNARFYRDLIPEMADRRGGNTGKVKASLDAAVAAIESTIVETAMLIGSIHSLDQMPSSDELIAEYEASKKD